MAVSLRLRLQRPGAPTETLTGAARGSRDIRRRSAESASGKSRLVERQLRRASPRRQQQQRETLSCLSVLGAAVIWRAPPLLLPPPLLLQLLALPFFVSGKLLCADAGGDQGAQPAQPASCPASLSPRPPPWRSHARRRRRQEQQPGEEEERTGRSLVASLPFPSLREKRRAQGLAGSVAAIHTSVRARGPRPQEFLGGCRRLVGVRGSGSRGTARDVPPSRRLSPLWNLL